MLPWLLLDTKNGPKQHKKFFFARRAKKDSAEGRSPPQELEVGPRSGPYLLVLLKGWISPIGGASAVEGLQSTGLPRLVFNSV